MKQPQTKERRSLNEQVQPESDTRLLFQLLKCSHCIERETNTLLRPYGLKQQQFAVLNEVAWNGPISQRELCENLLFEKSNISRIVKLLTEKGMVQVTADPLDRRLTLLSETAAGLECWRDCIRALNESSAEYVSWLSRAEVEETFKRLRLIEKSLKGKRSNVT